MSLEEKIADLAQRLPKLAEHLKTEEATKNALVMPFIAALGYDIFDPQEVVPEFSVHTGMIREKVDYAIVRDGEVILLIECRRIAIDVRKEKISRLCRCFSATGAKVAIVTNGAHYRCFSSGLEETDKEMGEQPFLEFDLLDPRPETRRELEKLGKDRFDPQRDLGVSDEVIDIREIKRILATQFANPAEELVRFFFSRVKPGEPFTATEIEQFRPLVSRAFSEYFSGKALDRLRSAPERECVASEPQGRRGRRKGKATMASIMSVFVFVMGIIFILLLVWLCGLAGVGGS